MPTENNIAERPERAALAVVMRGDKYLVIKRSQSVRAPGQTCFPGGGVEEGETTKAAVQRELLEELNLQCTPVRLLWTSQSAWNVDLHWWLVTIADDAKIEPNPEEVESHSWLTAEETAALPNLLSSNAEFFKALARSEFILNSDA